jgi:DNA-binding response OmpR family regulator
MSKKKILVVDDDQILLRILGTKLRNYGYETVFASDGVSAVSVAQKERPDLIILDIGLPAGDGFLLLRRLRSFSFLSVTPIIVLSAREKEENEKRVLDDGAYAFFEKPADDDKFLSAIREALGETGEPAPEKKEAPRIIRRENLFPGRKWKPERAALERNEESEDVAKKILIVGENIESDEMAKLQHYLQQDGHEVIISTNQYKAIKLAMYDKPDVIILRFETRSSIGFRVLERLDLLPSPIPVVILNGSSQPSYEKQAIIAGAVAFLHKSSSFAEILSAIKGVFEKTA